MEPTLPQVAASQNSGRARATELLVDAMVLTFLCAGLAAWAPAKSLASLARVGLLIGIRSVCTK
jgi:hypothetical protein